MRNVLQNHLLEKRRLRNVSQNNLLRIRCMTCERLQRLPGGENLLLFVFITLNIAIYALRSAIASGTS